MTSEFPKLLGLTIIVVLQTGCCPNDAHPAPKPKRGNGIETFKFNPNKKYDPAPQKPPEGKRENSERPKQ